MRNFTVIILSAAMLAGHAGPSKAETSTSPLASQMQAATPKPALEVVAFWREAGPALWFAKDPAFDARFRERFTTLHEQAARGELDAWTSTPEGTLALIILVDQFPRNAFRGTPKMYATDAQARALARAAIGVGHDLAIDLPLRLFVYLPLGHSEDLRDQEESVRLAAENLRPEDLVHAEGHRDIIKRFGRFPHRNPILGRAMRPEEQDFLDAGGYAG
jgi:uncharacterized protein (DUF924 family)